MTKQVVIITTPHRDVNMVTKDYLLPALAFQEAVVAGVDSRGHM